MVQFLKSFVFNFSLSTIAQVKDSFMHRTFSEDFEKVFQKTNPVFARPFCLRRNRWDARCRLSLK
jgi:hypothetical protein